MSQTYWWLIFCCFAMSFCCLSVDYGQQFLSPEAQFWIWNIFESITYEGIHFILPYFLDIPGQGSCDSDDLDFYVRKPALEPRRPKMSTLEKNVSFIYTIGTPGTSKKTQKSQDYGESSRKSKKSFKNDYLKFKTSNRSSGKSMSYQVTNSNSILHGREIKEVQGTPGFLQRKSTGLPDVN